jgi:thioester reductase-like protein
MMPVLLTGITGFVGGATAAELMSNCPDIKLLAIVRASDSASAEERLRRSLARFDRTGRLAQDLRWC